MNFPVALPAGWESKIDATSGKTYFVNHSLRSTSWEDPRYSHPSIWTKERSSLYTSIQEAHGNSLPDKTLRAALLYTNFNFPSAQLLLVEWGYDPGRRRHDQQSAPEHSAPTAASPARSPAQGGQIGSAPPRTAGAAAKSVGAPGGRSSATPIGGSPSANHSSHRGRAEVEALCSAFPDLDPTVIQDVLAQCNYDFGKAGQVILETFGGDAATESQKSSTANSVPASRRPKQHTQREAKRPSPAPIHEIRETKHEETKEEREERIRRALASLAVEFRDLPADKIRSLVEKHGADLRTVRAELRKLESEIAKNKEKTSSSQPLSAVVARITQPRPVDEQQRRDMPSTSASSTPQRAPERKRKDEGPEKPASTHATVALGPDPNNAKGPDASLLSLSGGGSVALGPDPGNAKGPDPTLLIGKA